ncbi:glycosyl hydrolase [Paenibacillus sp. MMS20-IR301]|uniref:glycosyl hydrolase n=1 Tax=Paenibacillus sp. MMS20-IR301 TaxID=2895946 RepID=UPI0028EBC780|nr:glycosyl hydrolase [Paenibacillus sp. MMS20-IR301]WNS41272.1 glycosyl hydrolase [Paenibacillus sp. MMS20-IR301]
MNTYRKYQLYTTLLPIIFILTLLPWSEVRSLPVTRVMDTAPAATPAAAVTPINPSASEEAASLLSYLIDLGGKSMISGQHDYLESPDEFNNKLKNASGQYAVLHGYELGAINNQSEATIARQRQAVIDSAIKWHQGGGIVAMTFHQNLPGTSPEWANVHMSLSQDKFDAYVTPGTQQYKALIADLDEVAVYLGELRDAGVPVLWRPYHEMNGNWFWWGQKDNFNRLWDIVYDRMVNKHKLNNLLWVWNPNAPNEWAEAYSKYYPGLDKVDILAADIYNDDFKQSYYENLLKLAGGKPIGIGESGELPDPVILSQTQSKWVYTMTWGKMLLENNNLQEIKSFMSNKYTVSREDYKQDMIARPSVPAVTSPYGLKGEYFGNTELSGAPLLTRTDSRIDFNWHGDSPAATIGEDSFSVRWTGTIKPLYSEKYTFTASSDDGIRVWIGGKLIIDSWKKQSGISREGSIVLSAATAYDIKVEYFENYGDASVRLMWQSPSQKQAVIPRNALMLP